jgi:DNA mismatch endonuclease, patch repair protein
MYLQKQNLPSENTRFGGLTRSELMSRIRSTGNKSTEEKLLRLLRLHRITGWRRHAKLTGKPDFVWPKLKIALFVDGCFWHGHNCDNNTTRKQNVVYWRNKILGNRLRDKRVARNLRKKGWSVIRLWECRLARDPGRCLNRIILMMSKKNPAGGFQLRP